VVKGFGWKQNVARERKKGLRLCGEVGGKTKNVFVGKERIQSKTTSEKNEKEEVRAHRSGKKQFQTRHGLRGIGQRNFRKIKFHRREELRVNNCKMESPIIS